MAAPAVSEASWGHDEVMLRKWGRSYAADGGAGSTQVSALPPKADIFRGDVQFSSRAGDDTAMASDRMPHLATGHSR